MKKLAITAESPVLQKRKLRKARSNHKKKKQKNNRDLVESWGWSNEDRDRRSCCNHFDFHREVSSMHEISFPPLFCSFLSYYFQLKCDVLVSALRALTYSTMPQPLLRYCNNWNSENSTKPPSSSQFQFKMKDR